MNFWPDGLPGTQKVGQIESGRDCQSNGEDEQDDEKRLMKRKGKEMDSK
jgi:hypothetical protein